MLRELLQKFSEIKDAGPNDENLIECIKKWSESNKLKEEELFQRLSECAQTRPTYACLVGFSYHYGIGTSVNLFSMIKWYTFGAENGDSIAQAQLGWCYSNGFGVEANPVKAFFWDSIAAQAGNNTAAFNLAQSYVWGLATPRDYKKAYSLYKKSADGGCAIAQSFLARCYQCSYGTQKDIHKALSLYKRASKNGFAEYDWEFKEIFEGTSSPFR
ncbi:hypothetical protein G9A89_023272 [Geosiphon pyriformis]|nr:hypothetical protein G9A89_023272 [Geosiphon pyriformis]